MTSKMLAVRFRDTAEAEAEAEAGVGTWKIIIHRTVRRTGLTRFDTSAYYITVLTLL